MFDIEAAKKVIRDRLAVALGVQQPDPMTAVYKQKMHKWHNKYQAERKRHQETKDWLEFRLAQLNVLSEEIETLTSFLDNPVDKQEFRATLDGVQYVKASNQEQINTSEQGE